MTRKRSTAKATSEPPISGVAAGSLGTAANLDDTQVFRTEDLQAAAPGWFDDDGPSALEDSMPPEDLASPNTAGAAAPGAAPAAGAPRPRSHARRAPSAGGAAPSPAGAADVPFWRKPSMPALAGVAALAVLLLFAGAGFLSQLDLGIGTAPGPDASANILIEAAPSPTPEPNAGKGEGHGKCHGRGHNCQGNED